jgi:hypothetical protein
MTGYPSVEVPVVDAGDAGAAEGVVAVLFVAVLFVAGDFLAVLFFFAVERFRVVAFLAPERPEAVMPAARSRSRTRFFTESRSERVATPIVFIWFWISSRM